MNIIWIVVGFFISILLFGPVQAATVESYFPSKNLGRFLSEKFDLSTIRSSFEPCRTPAKRTFADFGMKPSLDRLIGRLFGSWRLAVILPPYNRTHPIA